MTRCRICDKGYVPKFKNIWKDASLELPYDAKKDEESGYMEVDREFCFVLWEFMFPGGRTTKLILSMKPIEYYGGEFKTYGKDSPYKADWKRVRYWCSAEDMENYLRKKLRKKVTNDTL